MKLDHKNASILAATMALALLACGLLAQGCGSAQSKSAQASVQQTAQAASPAADFSLPDQDGNVVTLQSLRGKAVVLDFIYTNCTDACPLLTSKLVGLQHSLKDAGLAERVVLVSITIDPKRDTPQVLKAYAKSYGADLSNWYWLRGDESQTKAVAAAYGISVQQEPDGSFGHTAVMLIIDPKGMIRAWDSTDYSPADLLSDVAKALS